jgi:hypothetical protein
LLLAIARSTLHRSDHFLDQAGETADIAAGIGGIAEPNDHQMLRRQYYDPLALIAGGKIRVARNAKPNAPTARPANNLRETTPSLLAPGSAASF